MALHTKVAQEIYLTYKNGVEAVTNMDDKSALFGTNDDDNPFADLEKTKREIKMLLLKILLTSAGEDLPQFFFNVQYMRLKDDDSSMLANSTSTVPTTNSCEEDGSYEMLFLLKSAVMVSDVTHSVLFAERVDLCGAVTGAPLACARNRLVSPPRRSASSTKNTRR